MASSFTPVQANENPPVSQVPVALSLAVQAATLPLLPRAQFKTLRMTCDGGTGMAVAFGNQAGLTISNGMFVGPNTSRLVVPPDNCTQVCVIGATAAGVGRFEPGIQE